MGYEKSPSHKKKLSRARKRYLKANAEARKATGEQKMREALERLATGAYEHVTHKRCTVCGDWKPIEGFSIRRHKLKSGVVHIRPESSCRKCCAERAKRGKERREAERREDALERHKRWKARLPAKKREERRRRDRERMTIKRREAGIPPRNFQRHKPSKRLPIEPIAVFLEKRHESRTEMEAMTGIDERRLRALEGRETRTVSLGTVDKLLVGLDAQHHFNDLYPLKEKKRQVGYGVEDPKGLLEKYRNEN